MKLDIGLVFKDTESTFKALAAGLSGFIGTYYMGFLTMLLNDKYQISFEESGSIRATSFFVMIGVSYFTWLFTDCMRRKLVIFIALCFMPLSMLMTYRAELFADADHENGNHAQELVIQIGLATIYGCFALMTVPIVPELVFNIKSYRQTMFDLKVNDFSAAVYFSFSSFGGFITSLVFPEGYLITAYDILLGITVTFIIFYACYIDIRSTCRKDKEEEEADFQRLSQKQP